MTSRYGTAREIDSWYAERSARHDAREREAWDEYLRTTRLAPDYAYDQAEPLAWRRLRRQLAELHHDRRRDAFERDRAVAEPVARRRAS